MPPHPRYHTTGNHDPSHSTKNIYPRKLKLSKTCLLPRILQYGFVFGIVNLAAFFSAPVHGRYGHLVGAKLMYNVGGMLQVRKKGSNTEADEPTI